MISDVYERHDSEPFKEPVDLSVYPVSKSLQLKYSNCFFFLQYVKHANIPDSINYQKLLRDLVRELRHHIVSARAL